MGTFELLNASSGLKNSFLFSGVGSSLGVVVQPEDATNKKLQIKNVTKKSLAAINPSFESAGPEEFQKDRIPVGPGLYFSVVTL